MPRKKVSKKRHRHFRYRFSIFGHVWTVYYLTNASFDKRYGEQSYGITECDDKTIYLCPGKLKSDTVLHELIHAYSWELCIAVANLKRAQLEEVHAELFSKYGYQMLRRAEVIVEAYSILQGKVCK